MESQSALVGSDCIVELDSPAAVDLDLMVVILPFDLEFKDSVRNYYSIQDLVLEVHRIRVDSVDD